MEGFTGCGSLNPTMAANEWKVEESSTLGCMSQVIFSIPWNPNEVGFNASEGMYLPAMREHTSKEQKLSSFMTLYRLLAAGVAPIRGGFFQLKWYGFKVCLPASRYVLKACVPTSKSWMRCGSSYFKLRKTPRCALYLRVLVKARCNPADCQEESSHPQNIYTTAIPIVGPCG